VNWLGSRWHGALAAALATGAIVSLLAALSTSAGAASCGDEFTGASGGKWNVAGNWSKGLPTSSTIVCWPAGTTVVGEGVDTADSIVSGGSLETNGAEITLADAADQSTLENLTIDGSGHLSGPGPLALTGNFLWTGSGPSGFSASAAMALTQTGGGSFVIEGSGQAYDEGGSISTTSPITISDKSFIAANFHGTPTLSTTSTVTFASGEYGGNGGGGLTLEAAGFVTTAATSVQDYNLHLTGDESSLGGSLTAVSFSSEPATSLTVPGGVTLSPDRGTISGTVTGAGTFKQGELGTTIVANGGALSTTEVEVPQGTLEIEKEATYDASTATTVTTGGTLEIGDSGKTGDLTLSPNGSRIGGGPASGSLAVSGNFLWTGGSAELSEPHPLELTQSGSGEFKIEGTGQAYLTGGSITTSSSISITNPEFITTGNASVTTTGVLSFGEGLLVPENGGDSATFTAASVAVNKGASYGLAADSLVLTGPGTTTVANSTTLESGQLTVSGGVLDLEEEGTVEPAVGSTTLTDGTLMGNGIVRGSLTNTGGVLEPGAGAPGELYVSGEYTQEAGGTLAIRIKSFVPDTGYATVRVKEPVTFGGKLSLTDEDGYIPESAHEYEVVKTERGSSGAFSDLVGPSGGLYEVDYITSGSFSGAWLKAKPLPAPVNTEAPKISGTLAAGQTLTCSPGAWSNDPTEYVYQWSRDGAAIAGATGQTYAVQVSDEDHTLTCTVTASNETGPGGPATSTGMSVPVPTPTAVVTTPTTTPPATTTPSTVPSVPLPLQCSGKAIVLISVRSSGHSVVLSGLALAKFAGQKVKITVSDVPKRYAKGKGGSAIVTPTGTFEAKLPMPTGRLAPLTRYTATVAGQSSLGLKLGRTLTIAGEKPAAGGAQVSFQLAGHIGRTKHTVTITRQVSCTQETTFETVALPSNGKLTVTLPAPSGAGSVSYYRAQTRIPAGVTYSLPIAVANGG
jgi:hypothetical protein